MKVLQETTKWKYPNHVYVLNQSGKLIGYHSTHHGWRYMTKPLSFYKKYRTFKDLGLKWLPADVKNALKACPSHPNSLSLDS